MVFDFFISPSSDFFAQTEVDQNAAGPPIFLQLFKSSIEETDWSLPDRKLPPVTGKICSYGFAPSPGKNNAGCTEL